MDTGASQARLAENRKWTHFQQARLQGGKWLIEAWLTAQGTRHCQGGFLEPCYGLPPNQTDPMYMMAHVQRRAKISHHKSIGGNPLVAIRLCDAHNVHFSLVHLLNIFYSSVNCILISCHIASGISLALEKHVLPILWKNIELFFFAAHVTGIFIASEIRITPDNVLANS